MTDLSIFARRLCEARETAGLTQEQLANRAGLTKASISSYENQSEKSKKPSLDKVIEISKVLNVSIDWLCGLEHDKSSVTQFSAETYLKSLVIAVTEMSCNVETTDNMNTVITLSKGVIFGFVKKVIDLLRVYRDGSLSKELYETCIDKLISGYKSYCFYCDNFISNDDARDVEFELISTFSNGPAGYGISPGIHKTSYRDTNNGDIEISLFLSEDFVSSLKKTLDDSQSVIENKEGDNNGNNTET